MVTLQNNLWILLWNITGTTIEDLGDFDFSLLYVDSTLWFLYTNILLPSPNQTESWGGILCVTSAHKQGHLFQKGSSVATPYRVNSAEWHLQAGTESISTYLGCSWIFWWSEAFLEDSCTSLMRVRIPKSIHLHNRIAFCNPAKLLEAPIHRSPNLDLSSYCCMWPTWPATFPPD